MLLLDEETDELVARAAQGASRRRSSRASGSRSASGFAGRVAADRRPIAIPDIDQAEILNPILRQKGIRSLLGVPLLVEGRVIGILHVGSLTPREFDAEDTRLLELAAARIGPGDRRTRACTRPSATRARRAEEALAELRALQDLADAALAHLDLDEMLDRGARAPARARSSADTAAILLLDPESDELVARAARGLEEEVERGVRDPGRRGLRRAGSPPSAGWSRSPTSTRPTSSTRSCARRASSRCSARR